MAGKDHLAWRDCQKGCSMKLHLQRRKEPEQKQPLAFEFEPEVHGIDEVVTTILRPENVELTLLDVKDMFPPVARVEVYLKTGFGSPPFRFYHAQALITPQGGNHLIVSPKAFKRSFEVKYSPDCLTVRPKELHFLSSQISVCFGTPSLPHELLRVSPNGISLEAYHHGIISINDEAALQNQYFREKRVYQFQHLATMLKIFTMALELAVNSAYQSAHTVPQERTLRLRQQTETAPS